MAALAKASQAKVAAVEIGAASLPTLRLACVADTHSRAHSNIAPLLERIAPHAILHAGDIGDHAVLKELRNIAPVHAVRGNIDARDTATPDVVVVDAICAAGRARLVLMHIAVNGPHIRAGARRLATDHAADLIVCGHSHVPFIGRDRGLTVFNPGSIGPRRFALPIVFGTIDLDDKGLRLRHFDCESGERWQPP